MAMKSEIAKRHITKISTSNKQLALKLFCNSHNPTVQNPRNP